MFTLTLQDFQAVRDRIAPHIKHTPLLTSRQLSEITGYDVRLKAELFQRVGSYKIRGPLNKFAQMSDEQKRRGVVCSSAGNHAQGVALAAQDPRHPRGGVHGDQRHAVEDRRDARLWRRGRAARHDLGRGEREGEGTGARRGTDLRASVRRRAADRRAGHRRAGDRAGLAGSGCGGGADRRRRADLAASRWRSSRTTRRRR